MFMCTRVRQTVTGQRNAHHALSLTCFMLIQYPSTAAALELENRVKKLAVRRNDHKNEQPCHIQYVGIIEVITVFEFIWGDVICYVAGILAVHGFDGVG